jgi:predicted ATPase
VFVGLFTIDAALAVVTDARVDQSLLFGAIDSLVAKSMVAARPLGAMMRYRLLDATRAYALEIGAEDAELAVRHASYYRRWLEHAGAEWPTLSNVAERAPHFAGLHNVRAALEWCFGASGNTGVGVGLAAAAAPVFLAMSLLIECHRWSERAIDALDETTRGGAREMQLQAALGLSLMFTRGHGEVARVALNRSLEIAEQLGDSANQLQLLGRLHMFHHRMGDQNGALHYARRSSAVAEIMTEPVAIALAHTILGISLSYIGDLAGARVELEAAVARDPGSQRTSTIFHGFDHYKVAASYLARTLWLQGHPAQAVERIHLNVKEAAQMDHPVTLAIALTWAVSVFIWVGDLIRAEQHADWAISHAESRSLALFLVVGRGLKGKLALYRGDAKGAAVSLQACLRELYAARYELLTTPFSMSLVEAFGASGRFAEAVALVDETEKRIEANGDLSFMPELLRVKGNLLCSMPQPALDEAETCFVQSLEWSRRQGALGWELRTAVDLAALWSRQGQSERARSLLRPVFEQFVEGRDTADLKAAQRLLATLD